MNAGYVGPMPATSGFSSYQLPSGRYDFNGPPSQPFRGRPNGGPGAGLSDAMYGFTGTPYAPMVGAEHDDPRRPQHPAWGHKGGRGHHKGWKPKTSGEDEGFLDSIVGGIDMNWLEENKFYVAGGALVLAGIVALLVTKK